MISYIDLASANDYINKDIDVRDIWLTLSDDDKISHIITATRRLDLLCWLGTKVNSDQMLEFPRNFNDEIETIKSNSSDISYRNNFSEKDNNIVDNNNSSRKLIKLIKNNFKIPEEIRKANVEWVIYELKLNNFTQLRILKELGIKKTTINPFSVDFKESNSNDIPEKVEKLISIYLRKPNPLIQLERV